MEFQEQVDALVQDASSLVKANPGVATTINTTYDEGVEEAAAEKLKEMGISVATWGGQLYVADDPQVLEDLTRLPDEEVEAAK